MVRHDDNLVPTKWPLGKVLKTFIGSNSWFLRLPSLHPLVFLQKIDNLPILVTFPCGTLATLSSEVNVPVAHGSTRNA